MLCELTFHAEQRLRLRVSELRSSGVCDDDFEQEMLKAIERACNGEYTKVRRNQSDQYVLCVSLGKCVNVTVIIIYVRVRYDGEAVRVITIIPTTKDKTIRHYCVDPHS